MFAFGVEEDGLFGGDGEKRVGFSFHTFANFANFI